MSSNADTSQMSQAEKIALMKELLPAVDVEAVEAIRAKYQEERDKRLNAQDQKGQGQYINDLAQNEQWRHLLVDPYVEERIGRAPVDTEMEVLCLGGGFG